MPKLISHFNRHLLCKNQAFNAFTGALSAYNYIHQGGKE